MQLLQTLISPIALPLLKEDGKEQAVSVCTIFRQTVHVRTMLHLVAAPEQKEQDSLTWPTSADLCFDIFGCSAEVSKRI